jgi:hypothetical protein
LLDREIRQSYVIWRELMAPLIILEFVSGDGREEWDATPWEGKFWVYETIIRAPFYGIYEVKKASVEVYHLVGWRYQLLAPNARQHYAIAPLNVELGIWQGVYQNAELPWLRWWDVEGRLLLTGQERAERVEAEQGHVLLIGKPGSGKSTSLERLLWEEADNALKRPDARIPVLVKRQFDDG